MKKPMILVAIAVVASFLFISGQAIAGPAYTLNWGYQLHASETACPSGDPILNVNRKIINSLDSGTGSNQFGYGFWAVINYVQHIKVVETAPGEFCATLTSQGKFESIGGDGPGCVNDPDDACDDGPPSSGLAAGVSGTFQGGMTQTFTGTFTPGDMRTKGNIGTFDHDCDTEEGSGCTGPGFSKWQSEYFSGISGLSYDWWGWVYHAGKNGSWVNSSDGNEGNIAGD